MILQQIDFTYFLFAGVWFVWKFQHPLKKGLKAVKPRRVSGPHDSLNQAYVRTMLPLVREHGGRIETEKDNYDHVGKYWIIRVITSAFVIVFVPVNEED